MPHINKRLFPVGILFFILAAGISPAPLSAQQYNPGFDKILCSENFSYATINAIAQGPKGFIWFGTDNGLYRFDGLRCVAYKHNPANTRTISSDQVSCLYLDRKKNLWIGTYKGLNRFDPTAETFIQYPVNEGDAPGLKNSEISTICEDKDGFLWLGTSPGGLKRFDGNTGKVKSYTSDSKNSGIPPENKVTSICEDFRGDLWIGTLNGLYRFEKEKETFTQYINAPGKTDTLKENAVRTIYQDRDRVLWVGTWGGGLHRYDRETGGFTCFLMGPSIPGGTGAGHNRVSFIHEDQTGILWIGTFGNGICKFSKEKGTFECFEQDNNIPRSISSNMAFSIFEDKTGLLWIGTYTGGVNVYDVKKETFSHFYHYPPNPNSLSNNIVLSIYEDTREPGQITWIGTYSGLNRFDRKNMTFTHFKHDPQDPYSISSNVIRSIIRDSDNVLWVGTDNGLNRLDSSTHKFTSYRPDPGNPRSIAGNTVVTICEDKKRQLWIGTNGGVNLFNRETKSFVNFKEGPASLDRLSGTQILCIHEQEILGGSVLWIGTYRSGLLKYNHEKRTLRNYNPGTRDGLSSNTIRAISEDNDGRLWLATDGGLHLFDPVTGKSLVYSEKDGLPNNEVNGILEDEKGYLWLSTQNDLCRFNKDTGEFQIIDESWGMVIHMFNHGAYHKSRSGEMFFGGINGFTAFFPGKIKYNRHVPDIVITDVKVFDQPLGIRKGLQKSILETGVITLSYEDYMFSVEFAALDFTCPGKNKYRYKMEGFDNDWIKTDASRPFASYTNLDPGKYIFRVKGTNNAGMWNQKGTSIKIIITPPLWKRWWFKGAVGLSVILLLVFFYLNRTRRLRRELAEQQRVQEILTQSRDEMERAKNLAEFRHAEIKKIMSAISSLLIVVDAKGKISQWNESAETFFNIPASQTNGRLFVQVLKDHISPGILNMIMEKGLGKDNACENFEIPLRFEDTGAKLLLGMINPILDSGGQNLGFLFLAEDITHRKEEEMRRNLSQKLESLGKMAGNIAHEIKSPLQYIVNNSYFIRISFENLVNFFKRVDRPLSSAEIPGAGQVKDKLADAYEEYDIEYILEEGPKASDQIFKGVSRVSTIVQSMLDYSHPGKGVMEPANIHELLETTLAFIRSGKKEIFQLETDFDSDISRVLCYPGELAQVFMNLLLNAVDAIRAKGKSGVIKITTSGKPNEIIVSIADNGCGIPAEIKNNIYNPFFTTKEVGKGTGQGLSQVHNIITERHKGKIYFESRVGEGTTFYVHLPLSPGDL